MKLESDVTLPDRLKNKAMKLWFRSRVKSRNFTVVSNDCWGSAVYPALGLAYQTPFVGLFIWFECYLKLLTNFRQLMTSAVRFTDHSRYPAINERRATGILRQDYPIGLLGDDVEVHFLHYSSDVDARTKWERRISRMTFDQDRLYVRFAATETVPTLQEMAAFDALPYPHKVMFLGGEETRFQSAVCIPSGDGSLQAPAGMHRDEFIFAGRSFDLADWLNGGDGKPAGLYKLVTNHLMTSNDPGNVSGFPTKELVTN